MSLCALRLEVRCFETTIHHLDQGSVEWAMVVFIALCHMMSRLIWVTRSPGLPF